MSDAITNHLNGLRQEYEDDHLRELRVVTPAEKAMGNVDKAYRVAQAAGGFVAYYVAGNEFHEEQHAMFCQELGIDETPRTGRYSILTEEDFTMVLTRQIDIDENETVYGVGYSVERVPHDRD